MKKLFVPILLILSLLTPQPIYAARTTKQVVPFEITNVVATKTAIVIRGWALYANATHHNSTKTHSYMLDLVGESEILRFKSNPTSNNQTDTMRQFNTRRCNDGELFKTADVCYYDYTYSGFLFMIPLEKLKPNEEYKVNLTVNVNIAMPLHFTTPIFNPIHQPIIIPFENDQVSITSSLYDTSLEVVYDNALDRVEPGKYSEVRSSPRFCSSTYGYKNYFESRTYYQYVYDRSSIDNTVYYKVKTSKDTTCKKQQNMLKEGNDNYSWIASNFVDYKGEQLTIKLTHKNDPPQLFVEHIFMRVNETVNPFDYVSALDKEDGDITDKIQHISGEIGNEPGEYILVFYVEDSEGLYDTKEMIVTVVKENQPPGVHATDHKIFQYTDFNYREGTSAFDREDGDLTSEIWWSGHVDIEELGIYYVTYFAMDSQGLIASKTISVEVIRNPRELIRYISPFNTFYSEDIPRNWHFKYPFLFEQLEKPRNFTQRLISKRFK